MRRRGCGERVMGCTSVLVGDNGIMLERGEGWRCGVGCVWGVEERACADGGARDRSRRNKLMCVW